jgi:hypothetical protein
MAVPHRHDTPSVIARRPYDYDKVPAQPSRRYEAWFTIVVPLIGKRGDASRKDQFCICEI